MFILDVIQRFFHFLKKPDQGSYKSMGTLFKTSTLLSLLLLNVVFTAIWVSGYFLIRQYSMDDARSGLYIYNYFGVLVTIVLIGPFLEELIFRLPMKYNRNYLLRLIVYLIGLNGTVEKKELLESNIKKSWRKYFWIFFYAMSSIFAFAHLFNYEDYRHLLFWSPILTCSQLLGGMIMGYLRIRFGFIWGWYYHALFNMLIIFLAMAFMGGFARHHHFPEKNSNTPKDWVMEHTDKKLDFKIEKRNFKSYQVDNSEYSLSIIEGKEFDGVISGYGVTPSRIFFDRTSAEHILQILSNDQIKVRDTDSLSLTVELKMKTPQKSTDKARSILERELFKALVIK